MTPYGSALETPMKAEAHSIPAFAFRTGHSRGNTLLKDARSIAPEKITPAEAPRPPGDIAAQLHGFIFTDIAALVVSLLCAWALAAAINTFSFNREVLNGLTVLSLTQTAHVVLIGTCLLLWFAHTGHYHVRMPFWMETKKIVEAAGFAMLIDGFLSFASKHDFSRLWLMSNWVFAAIGIMLFRALLRNVLRRRGLWQISTLLVGGGPTADDARVALDSEPSLGYNIVKQISDLPPAFEQAGLSWRALCAANGADYVVIALDGPDIMNAGVPLAQLMRESVPFSVSPPLQNLPVLGMVPQYFFNHDVMLLTRSHGLDQPLQRFFKRSFDILMAAGALLAFSPVFLAVALAIKLSGKGPIFYKHRRLGLNGKPFRCLKFRSMVTNGDAILRRRLANDPGAQHEWQRDYKLRDDPRVTAIGALLRRTSLDELPQIINVLKGDMSIVGPRPIILAEAKKYDSDITHYFRVRPGMTGLWQVSGRNDVSYFQRVQMDSWYVRNWTLWHDIAIICKTFPVIINKSGAY